MDIEVEEVASKETVNEKENVEKKENAFSKLWRKTKQSVSDTALEFKIESAFKKNNREATIYTKDALLSNTVYGYLDKEGFIFYGEEEVKEYAVLITEDDSKAYYVTSVTATTVCVEVEGVSYERPATLLGVDDKVTEVNVVKAGKRYFLYKGM